MGQAPSGMRLKSISAIGSTRFPTKPTLNSRPPMYSWTSTSSNCSVMAARRARSDLRSLTTEPRLLEQRVRDGLAAARGEGPEARARDGNPCEFERSHDMLFPLALPVDAFAQVEHEIRPARHLEPAHVVADADLADLVAHRGEDRADLVHGFHYAADVLGCPVFGAWVEQDDDLHAPTTARCWAGVARRVPASTVSSCPVSRRQAIRTTSWISSS